MALIQSHCALTRRGSQDTSTLRTAVEDLKRTHHQQTQQRGVRSGWEEPVPPCLELDQPAIRL